MRDGQMVKFSPRSLLLFGALSAVNKMRILPWKYQALQQLCRAREKLAFQKFISGA
jgi:hypothetical protein